MMAEVEIVRMANGYMVRPLDRKQDYRSFEASRIYVFSSFGEMIDKLQQILEEPRLKDEK